MSSSIGVGGEWAAIRGRPLSSHTLSFITKELGFATMSPVQAKTIPMLLANRDVVVEAITGSGKTLAYLVPIVETLLMDNVRETTKEDKSAVIALIVLPSRELAQQVHTVCSKYLAHVNKSASTAFSTCCFIGGRDMAVDVQLFQSKGGNVMIGTPGRLFELLVSSKHTAIFGVRHTEMVILDEADKLLEFGFKAKLDALLRRFPKQRRTGLFSATQTTELADLARAGMRNPISISVRIVTSAAKKAEEDDTKPQIPQQLVNYYACCRASEKLDRLLALLDQYRDEKILVYVITCAGAEWLHEALTTLLPGRASEILALHGQMKMPCRQRVHGQMKAAKSAVLVCTDVASRGLDIPNVGLVIQFDPPVDVHTFIHRIGRTARMGKAGVSVAFLLPEEAEYIAFLKHHNVALEPLDPALDTEAAEADDAGKEVARTLASVPPQQRTKRLRTGERKTKRKTVSGDVCESPAILQLRRASREKPNLLNLATRAFVSFIRAYKEHECRYIFQLKHIDVTDLVHAFALFKVPNCGEIRKMAILRIPLQDEFDDVIAQLDAERVERARKRQEEAERIAAEEREQHLHRSERNQQMEEIKHSGMSRNQKHRAFKQAELDELMREAYLVKKERLGRISSAKVDELVGNDALEKSVMSTRERKQMRNTKGGGKRPA